MTSICHACQLAFTTVTSAHSQNLCAPCEQTRRKQVEFDAYRRGWIHAAGFRQYVAPFGAEVAYDHGWRDGREAFRTAMTTYRSQTGMEPALELVAQTREAMEDDA